MSLTPSASWAMIYEGKAKRVYATEDPELLIVDYKDDATAFNGVKRGTIVGKGVINNQMSNRLMQRLARAGVPTHFVKELSERETLVKRVTIVPLEVIIRNIAAGSFAKRYGVEEGIVGKHSDADVVITEIGGTIGDIESQPFIEAARQVSLEVGRENSLFIHVTLVPYLRGSNEHKSKPTQHSVKELQGMGIHRRNR